MSPTQSQTPELQNQQAISTTNLINNTKTQQPFVPNINIPSKTKLDKHNNTSLSRKIYLLNDHEDRVMESVPTAKHTFMSEQVEINGEKDFDGFYTPREKDEKNQNKNNWNHQPDINSDPKKIKGTEVKSKSQRNRFYYKQDEYNSLNQVQIPAKDQVVKQSSVQPEIIKKQDVNQQRVKENNVNQLCVKPQSLRPLSKKSQSVKGGQQNSIKEILKPQIKQRPKSNIKTLSNYISKINKQQSPYAPLQQKVASSPFKKRYAQQLTQMQTPDDYKNHHPGIQSRYSNSPLHHSGSPLQQSHQKLFNKCYKQTYKHLKLMLNEIHQSQQHMHILHKQITNNVFDVIKQRAQALRKQMNELVEEIIAEWIKDEWNFIKTNEILFIDDLLQIEEQLEKREQQIHVLVDKLMKENRQAQCKQDQEQIFSTFNAKGGGRNLFKNSNTETSWKKVTTDLLMFNYESNIIEIQQLIDNISESSFQKCNKAIDLLPSSAMFAKNTHFQALNPEAKKWFKNEVLMFMNKGSTKINKKSQSYHSNSHNKSYNQPNQYYPEDVVQRAQQQKNPYNKNQPSPKQKIYLDKTYFLFK